MKTKIIGILFLTGLMLVGKINAQNGSAGILIGASTTSVKLSDFRNTAMSAAKGQGIAGFEGGVYGKFGLGPLYIKPMVLAGYQSGQLNINYEDGTTKNADFKDGKLEVPVMIGIPVFHFIGIEAGPVYNWMFMVSENADPGLHLQQSGLGYRVGANVQLGLLNVGLAYQGLSNMSNGASNTTFQSPNELILDVAIRLGGGSSK